MSLTGKKRKNEGGNAQSEDRDTKVQVGEDGDAKVQVGDEKSAVKQALECVIRAKLRNVGLFALNPRNDPRGYIMLEPGDGLKFNRELALIGRAGDPAVNVIAGEGEWKDRHVGHIPTIN